VESALINYLAGIVYGFSLAAPPGPMNALIASRSLASFRRGFLTGLGAMTADFILMIITYAAVGMINSSIVRFIYILGGAYMIFLALATARSNLEVSRDSKGSRTTASIVSYTTSLALGLTNPYQVLWWFSAGLSFMSIFGLEAIAGLFTAILLWIIIFPLFVRAGYYYGGRFAAIAVKIFSVAVLTAFALLILYEGLKQIS